MADIASQIESTAKAFGELEKNLTGSSIFGGAFEKQLKYMMNRMEKAGESLEDFSKSGRLTEDQLDNLTDQLKKTNRLSKDQKKVMNDHLKTQKEIQGMTDKFTSSISDAIKSVTTFIPIVGDKIAEVFDKKII